MADPVQTVAEYWSVNRKRPVPISWLEHPAILANVHRRVTGDPMVSTYQWFKNAFLPEGAGLALSLGCGFGAFERGMIAIGAAHAFHANDIAEGAIAAARTEAENAGLAGRIRYDVANLDEIVLPEKAYDAIFGISSIHHVARLEHVLHQCRRALKPGALLFLDEYVGPSRFQTEPHVSGLIDALLKAMPVIYRRNLHSGDGTTIDGYKPSPVEHFLKVDPSEAIRSADILACLREEFEIVAYRPYGGAILHMLLTGITGNFRADDPADVAFLQSLADFEEALEDAGAIASDFSAIVARPKPI